MDVTLRDGAYLFNHNYPLDVFRDLVACLDEARMPYVEIGHGVSVGARDQGFFGAGLPDLDYARAARETAKTSRLGMVALPLFANERGLQELRPHLDFLRVGVNVHLVADAERLMGSAKKLGYQVFFQMIRTSRVSPQKAAQAAKAAESMGADAVYLVDSAGAWSPWMVRAYVEEALASVKIPVGIHAHDHLGTALANTIEAVRAGCRFADASLRGAGRGAGNVQMELLLIHLGRMGLQTGIDEDVLQVASRRLEEDLPDQKRGVGPDDFLPASLGLDIYPVAFFMTICREAGIDLPTYLRALSKIPNLVEIGTRDMAAALESLGLDAKNILRRAGVEGT